MYCHKPLPRTKTIRVLILEPAPKISCPVSCTLKELCLDGLKPGLGQYEALSYVWGSPKGNETILCHGEPLHVTENCLAALRHLRQQRRPRILWVDALCIDQSSLEERNHQVALMGEVYRMARCVLIWLGVGTSVTRRMMRFLWWNKEISRLGAIHYPSSRLVRRLLGLLMVEVRNPDRVPDYFHDALPIDWFTRVWLVIWNALQ